MNRCMRITFENKKVPEGYLRSFVQKHARKLGLEGSAQVIGSNGHVRIEVCGSPESIDSFLDVIHKGTTSFRPGDVEVEPFLKEKDYRGVFRVIE